jgi:hypothetical protein
MSHEIRRRKFHQRKAQARQVEQAQQRAARHPPVVYMPHEPPTLGPVLSLLNDLFMEVSPAQNLERMATQQWLQQANTFNNFKIR